jgi:mono/diheme cytochrome c family protein
MRRTLGVSVFIAAAWFSAAQAQAPAAAASDGEFVEAPEKAVVQKSCTGCHVAGQVTSQRKSADQWTETVEKMISYGAKVSDAEFATIVSYLSKHYGTAPAPGAGGR